jgi:hypothetical protein
MLRLEQAIFTSAQTSRSSGYQIVAHSEGLSDAELRELAAWGPSHDSLWESGPSALSVNFHRLASGRFCVSQTAPAGEEFSQRRGPQLYTQQLVVSRDDLIQFANNPFALLQAAVAGGYVQVLDKFPKLLDPISLAPSPVAVSAESLTQLCGAEGVAEVLQAALGARSLGLVAGQRGGQLVAALFNALPLEWRSEFSFTTGLRFSPCRPFRLVCLPNNRVENQRYARQYELALLDLSAPQREVRSAALQCRARGPEASKNKPAGPCSPHAPREVSGREIEGTTADGTRSLPATLTGWAAFVAAVVETGNTTLLAAELNRPHNEATLEALERLGNLRLTELREDGSNQADGRADSSPSCAREHLQYELSLLDSGEESWQPAERQIENGSPAFAENGREDRHSAAASLTRSVGTRVSDVAPAARPDTWQRSHGQHDRVLQATSVIADAYCGEVESLRNAMHIDLEPAAAIAQHLPQQLETLQRLEDAIFEAMAGKPAALEELRTLWRHVLQIAGVQAEQAREQYLAYAISLWRQFSTGDNVRDPARATQAVEVICQLLDRST